MGDPKKMNDSTFCATGLVYADRKPYPYLEEVKHVYRNIKIKPKNVVKGEFMLYNNFFFTKTSNFKFEYAILKDGKTVDNGEITNLTVNPNDSIIFNIPISNLKIDKNSDYFVNFQAVACYET